MIDILISAGAEKDYLEALCWYAERSQGAASGFEAEFQHALESIAADPDRFPSCDNQHRFFLMRRYPFQVIYREVSAGSIIVAVAHGKRRPGYWVER
jgi:plasmid stabilization system protein ParE